MPPHTLTNFEILRHYQNEPRFNGVYARENLPKKIKDWAYIIILYEYSDVGTHWNAIVLYCKDDEIVYIDSFGFEHLPKEIKKFIERKNIKANLLRVQSNDSIICEYFCTGFINFTSFFLLMNLKKNDVIILKYFKDE